MKKKGQKGSVTLFVLVAGMFFIIFLTSMFMLAAVERQAQIEATEQTQDIYSQGNANEIYQNYFGEGTVVPIYTRAQLEKICSGEQIAINEEGGKIYTFSENSIYLLKDDITFEYEGVWKMPLFGETGRIEGNGKKITIKDTSKEEEFYYYYTDLNRYKEPLTEEGYLLSWDKSKVSTTKVEESTIAGVKDIRIVPIPEGFIMSSLPEENTVAGGLVIYEGTDNVTDADEDKNDIIDAQENRNQYVWIPVDDINSMVMCKSNASGSVCSLELIENTLKCTVHDLTATELCGRSYNSNASTKDETSPKTYTTSMNFADRTQNWSDSGYREPAVLVNGSDNDKYTGNLTVFTSQMINDFVNMSVSVAKYGGFYVSRYEAGENGASKKNQIVLVGFSVGNESDVYKGVGSWYGLYNAVRKTITIGESTMQGHMIYGSQYDQIINFIGSEAETGHPGDVVTEQSKTGTKETDKLKNIYDLEGNNQEWTAQAVADPNRVLRGGEYTKASDGLFYPASSRDFNHPYLTYGTKTTRLSLYL